MQRSNPKPSVEPAENNMPARAPAEEPERHGLMKRLRAWLRSNLREKHHDNSLKEALEEVLEEHEEEGSHFAPEEQNMLKNLLSFSDLTVIDIMTPRTEIKAVEYNTTPCGA